MSDSQFRQPVFLDGEELDKRPSSDFYQWIAIHRDDICNFDRIDLQLVRFWLLEVLSVHPCQVQALGHLVGTFIRHCLRLLLP